MTTRTCITFSTTALLFSIFLPTLAQASSVGTGDEIKDCSLYMQKSFPLEVIKNNASEFQAAATALGIAENSCDSTVIKLSFECPKLADQRQNSTLNSKVATLLEDAASHCQNASDKKLIFERKEKKFSRQLEELKDTSKCRGTVSFLKKMANLKQKNLSSNYAKALNACGNAR